MDKRKCPIDGKKVKASVGCPRCAIMSGLAARAAFSDGKYNITNAFGGTLYEHIGREQAIGLIRSTWTRLTWIMAAGGRRCIRRRAPS